MQLRAGGDSSLRETSAGGLLRKTKLFDDGGLIRKKRRSRASVQGGREGPNPQAPEGADIGETRRRARTPTEPDKFSPMLVRRGDRFFNTKERRPNGTCLFFHRPDDPDRGKKRGKTNE